MRGTVCSLLPALLLAVPLTAAAAEQLIPAGALVQCTVSEPKLSSKTVEVGDPVLCQVSHVELYGRAVFPYGSYLVGHFEDYKDPGHFVGKGWMELKFDRMVIPPDTVLPVAAKVVYVPKYPVDKEGRIHGTGHAVRDVVEWSIPVLWPIDILTLPRRGPRPVLKPETRLTLKLMDDLGVPIKEPNTVASNAALPPTDSYGFAQRPTYYSQPVAPPPQHPITIYMPPSPPPAPVYVAPPPPVYYRAAPPAAYYPAPTRMTVFVLRDGNRRFASNYWFEGDSQVRYIAPNGASVIIPMYALDMPGTVQANRAAGVNFAYRTASY